MGCGCNKSKVSKTAKSQPKKVVAPPKALPLVRPIRTTPSVTPIKNKK